MTKGVKAYEALLFKYDEYNDSLTKIEQRIDDELTDLTSERFVEQVNKINVDIDGHISDDFGENEFADRVNIHLPKILNDQITIKRGVGEHLADAVFALSESVYSDRLDRVNAKRELVEFIEDNRSKVDHPVAYDIVHGAESYDVEEVHKEFAYETEDNWWESDDLTVQDLRERGTDITQGAEHRVSAVETAIRNTEEEYTVEEAEGLMRDVFNVSEPTLERYMERIDMMRTSTDTVHIDTVQIASQNIVSDTVDTSDPEAMEDYIGLESGLVQDEEMTRGEAVSYVDDLVEEVRVSLIGSDQNTDRAEAKNSFRTWLKALRAMLGDDHTEEDDEGVQNVIRMYCDL